MYADVSDGRDGPESYVASVCSSDPRCVAYDWAPKGHYTDREARTGRTGNPIWRLCSGLYWEKKTGAKMCVKGTNRYLQCQKFNNGRIIQNRRYYEHISFVIVIL